MSKKLTILILIFLVGVSHAQVNNESEVKLQNNLILNFLNPGVEYELSTSKFTLIAFSTGVGYSGNFEEITGAFDNGFQYDISPFVAIEYKWIYNRKKRLAKKKSLLHNSGNFVSLRTKLRGPSIESNFTRLDDLDFFIGPTWGFQRLYNKTRLMVAFGPQFYFNSIGNSGFSPLNIQISFGINL